MDERRTAPVVLTEEQMAELRRCIDWYNLRINRGRETRADYNPPEIVTTSEGSVVRYAKSLHVLSPAFWLHYHYDHVLRAFGHPGAAERIVEFRARIELLQSSNEERSGDVHHSR